MTIARRSVVSSLMNCLSDPAQAEKVREWSERAEGEHKAPALDSASAALLFAAALGDAASWASLAKMHPTLEGLDVNDMPSVLDRLFTGNQS